MLCYIGIGSNLGNRQRYIEKAIQKLKRIEDIKVKRVSGIYETEPIVGPKQGKYLNGAVEIETALEPGELLLKLQAIENELGRIRTVKNGPRTIDLDILLYGDKNIDEPDLKIPHPRMYKREFVIKPLKDLEVNLSYTVCRRRRHTVSDRSK